MLLDNEVITEKSFSLDISPKINAIGRIITDKNVNLLVKYLTTSVEFQAEFSKTSGYVPVIKSVFDNLNYKAWLSRANGKSYIQARSCKVCKEQADHYFTSPAFNGSADARDAVGTLVYRAMISSSESAIPGLFDEAIGQCELSSL